MSRANGVLSRMQPLLCVLSKMAQMMKMDQKVATFSYLRFIFLYLVGNISYTFVLAQ